jgi:hypothetical protein
VVAAGIAAVDCCAVAAVFGVEGSAGAALAEGPGFAALDELGREVTRQFPAGIVAMRRFRFAPSTRTTAFVLQRRWCDWLKFLWLACDGKANREAIRFLAVRFSSFAAA